MRGNLLYTVIPCYNEEEALPETARQLALKYGQLLSSGMIGEGSRIVFVNDGSKDRTWELICALHRENPLFSGICLSRNRGHQNALLAGLMTVRDRADMVISMDADLQDDIGAMDEMIAKYQSGCDVVYGVRSSRKKDRFFKRFTAEAFYRLMSRRALDGLAKFEEVNLFLRGIVPMVGYPSDIVLYERGERTAGESKYPLKKMVSFALEGVTSLSTKPLRMITLLGFLIFLISLILLAVFIVQFFIGMTVPGWASVIVSLWGIGGLLMLAIGIVGEYIGKIYLETKKRPRFLIADFLEEEKDGGRDRDA